MSHTKVHAHNARKQQRGTVADSDLPHAPPERPRLEQLLRAVNDEAAVLLAPADEADFKTTLHTGMEIISRCVDVDRSCLWQNATLDGVFHYVNQCCWQGDNFRWKSPPVMKRPYSDMPEWERRFRRNEIINGPLAGLAQEEQSILGSQGVKSILAIPLYWQGSFYGFFSLDDCRRDRSFTEDEVNILRSAGLMMVSAVNRNKQAIRIREQHELAWLMLDATPLSCHLWDSAFRNFECNAESLKLFHLKDKQEYLERFYDLSPEYQPDGRPSRSLHAPYLTEALAKGK